MKTRRRRVSVSLMLLSAAQPAWALGDFIIPQTAGLVLGGPMLLALFFSFVWAATKYTKANQAAPKQLVIVTLWGLLFNGVWLGLLYLFDPATWGLLDGWSANGFVGRYVLPNAGLVLFLLFRGWAHRAAVVAASCLLLGLGYWLGVT